MQLLKSSLLNWLFQVPETLTFKTTISVSFSSEEYIIIFQVTGFALSLALKQRLGATRKWPGKFRPP